MTRQSISLTTPNDECLKAQIESEEYTSKSEVVNDLIRKARAQEQENEWIRQKLIVLAIIFSTHCEYLPVRSTAVSRPQTVSKTIAGTISKLSKTRSKLS